MTSDKISESISKMPRAEEKPNGDTVQATDLPTEPNRIVEAPSRAEDKRSEETVQPTSLAPDRRRIVKLPSPVWANPSDPTDFSIVRLRSGRGHRDREEYNMGSHWSDDSDDRDCCCEVM